MKELTELGLTEYESRTYVALVRLGKTVLLVFSRYFGCPPCQVDWDDLVKLREETGVQVFYFTQSSPESARRYLGDSPVDFHVISVPEEDGRYRIYDDYGVGRIGLGTAVKLLIRVREARGAGKAHGEQEGKETQSPADFIVDGEGVIRRAHVGVFEAEEIRVALRSLDPVG